MIAKFGQKLYSSSLGAGAVLASGFGFSIEKFLLASSEVSFVDRLIGIFSGLYYMVIKVLFSWIYMVCRLIFNLIDILQVFIQKMLGLSTTANAQDYVTDSILFKFVFNEKILTIMFVMLGLALVLILVFAIIGIIKSEYMFATDQLDIKKEKKNSSSKTISRSLASVFLLIFTPVILFVSIIFSTAILNSVNNALTGGKNYTFGGQIFASSSYDANRYRIYAKNNQRIPILFDFVDPYDSGAYKYLTYDEVAEEYKNWNNEGLYNFNLFYNGIFETFSTTTYFKNNKLYNRVTTYGGYENFVCTAEQYYVMADFIDYAVKNNLVFYIKDSTDKDIFWDEKSSTGASISEGVYNKDTGSLTIAYNDISNLVSFTDFYKVIYETGLINSSTPIQDAVETISMILGLAGNSDATSFRMLERVDGSQNVVRWKTEKAYNSVYGEQSVFHLTKKVRNLSTQTINVVADCMVAKKENLPSAPYYIVTPPTDGLGYYEYTSITIDFVNDSINKDEIVPLYAYGTWPEKLYNDLKVIYKDINIDNYINYDTWADSLGSYFMGGVVTSENVSNFSTSLIHPLGLIMSELFLGDIYYGDGITESDDVHFASIYLKDTTDAIVKAVGTQYEYRNIMGQIDYFCKFFNNIMGPVIENLAYYETFELVPNDPYDVYSYVYKSYLASLMLSSEFANYLYDNATLGVRVNALINDIIYSSGSTYEVDGQTLKVQRLSVDNDGNYIVNYYRDSDDIIQSKKVFDSRGKLVATCDINGVLNEHGRYIPLDASVLSIEKNDDGVYQYNSKGDEQIAYVQFYKIEGTTLFVYDSTGNYVEAKNVYTDESITNYDDFYTYESYEETLVNDRYMSFASLTISDRDLVNDIYNYYISKASMLGTNAFDEYIGVLSDYISGSIVEVLTAKAITRSEFESIKSRLSTIQQEIVNLQEIVNYSPFVTQKAIALSRIQNLSNTLNKYKKYLLTDALSSYVSERLTSSLTIVVNGKNYTISHNTSYTEFYEYVLGNKLVNKTLIASLSNKQPYTNLGVYDKNTLSSIKNRIFLYKQDIAAIIEKLERNNIGAVGYSSYDLLSNTELDFVNSVLTIMSGQQIKYSYNNTSFINSKEIREKAIDSIQDYYDNIEAILNTYISGGTTTDENFAIILNLVQNYTTERVLNYVHDDYEGIVDSSGTAFGLLKSFLHDFGNLCFDINNKSNLTSLTSRANDEYVLSYYIDQLITTIQKELYGFNVFDFTETYSTLNNKYFSDLPTNQQNAFVEIFNFFVEQSSKDSNDTYVKTAMSIFRNITENKTRIVYDSVKDYIDYYINDQLESGLSISNITEMGAYETTSFARLSTENQNLMLALMEIYNSKISEYQTLEKTLSDAHTSLKNYISNRYPITQSSIIYQDYLQKWLTAFERYAQPVEDDNSTYFKENSTYAEAISFYNLYIAAFENVEFGANGVFFDQLSELQQNVLRDANKYYTGSSIIAWSFNRNFESNPVIPLIEKLETKLPSHNQNIENLKKLTAFVSGSTKLSEEIINYLKSETNELNKYKLFDYLGIEYSPSKTLKEYRLDAMRNLINFEEYIGENAESIQRRYLANMYLFLSDYSLEMDGKVYIKQSSTTKNILFELAGITNRPDETIVGLEYEVDFSESRSDEQYGSVFVICVYDEENARFAPFLFATADDKKGTPVCTTYFSTSGDVMYYPVIAKGIFDNDGLPTAIRNVNGNIEFYRHNIVSISMSNFDMYLTYQSTDEIKTNNNPISKVVNSIKNLVTGKSLSDRLSGIFPKFNTKTSSGNVYGTEQVVIYTLEGGKVALDYNFSKTNAIQIGNLFDVSKINIIILMFGTVALFSVLMKAVWGLVNRVYYLVILFIIYPPIVSTFVYNDDRFKRWREDMIGNILSIFGFLVAIDFFFILLPILESITFFSSASIEKFQQISFLKNTSAETLNGLVYVVFLFVAFLTIESTPKLIKTILGGEDLIEQGEDTRTLARENIEKMKDYASGYAVMDSVTRFKNTATSFLPLTSFVKKKKQQATELAEKAVEVIAEKYLEAHGVPPEVAGRAVSVLRNTMDELRENRHEYLEGNESKGIVGRRQRFEQREEIRASASSAESKRFAKANADAKKKKKAAEKNERFKK